eukprot:TRINITY_DN556_c0_g1_i4.p1 TRINITY_DN556_c0_g1~~TRINITY_DN556_c0_g1_i4.p1  ORF type:complete len:363 (+),score=37.28 TRINITY_DN556_c0_g1_i4:154-1242(+)
MGSSSSGINAWIVVGIIVALLVVALSVAACILLWCWDRKKQAAAVLETGLLQSPAPSYATAVSRRTSSSGSIETFFLTDTVPAVQTTTRRFSYATLQKATNDFHLKIGEGSFGDVYYGRLNNGQEVAVKVSTDGRDQGEREFVNEVQLLSTVHHKNLVHLVGYCQHENIQILVYEFMAGGDLRSHLYGPEASLYPLTWNDRLRIASEAAQGVYYLHNSIKPRIIHRDVKTSNILLSRSLEAKVADFGLSKLTPDADCTHVTTTVKGTRGYLDPEYYTTRQLTEYSDVYSFGVLFMELICGRPPIPSSMKQKPLVDWVRVAPCLNLGVIQHNGTQQNPSREGQGRAGHHTTGQAASLKLGFRL